MSQFQNAPFRNRYRLSIEKLAATGMALNVIERFELPKSISTICNYSVAAVLASYAKF